MKRREFITLIGGAAATSSLVRPLAARAQQPAMTTIGLLYPSSPEDPRLRAFHQGLAEAGYVEGRNVTIESRWAQGQNDRLPAMAADLVARQVTVLVTTGIPAIRAAQAATATIPICFAIGEDPVKLGILESLNKPGGNATGVFTLGVTLGPKRMELLHEVIPAQSSFAILLNPTNPTNFAAQTREMQDAGNALGRELVILNASSERDLEAVFAKLRQLRAGALIIGTDGFMIGQAHQLGALAMRHRIPAIFQNREFATAGGLMSYGDSTDLYRQVGIYTGRMLKGEKPADLPVVQVTKVELIINLKTAKALDITFPLTLLGRADEVIE